MKNVIENIVGCVEQLTRQIEGYEQQLRILHWEDDALDIQILQSDLDFVEWQLAVASMVNCTPHPITIEGLGDLPPSGILPRVSTEYRPDFPLSGVRVRQKVQGGTVTGLPEPVDGITFIVSGMVRDALSLSDAMSELPEFQSRPDVYAPDTGADAIRNEKGHIVAVRGLVQ